MRVIAVIVFLMGCLSCTGPKYTYDFGQPPAASLPRKTELAKTPELIRERPEFEATLSQEPVAGKATAGLLQRKARAREEVEVLRKAEPPGPVVRDSPPLPAKSIDSDLKRSAIFLVGGTVALIIGGDVFVVAGSLSLLIGLIFGIKWLLRE
jgi:hypothetical protein